jgi:YD repeat-containing protein
MGMRKVISAVALMLIAPLAQAQTTRTYSYDALGRLVKVTPSSGNPVTYNHDAGDNRTSVVAGITNNPPVATNDTFYLALDNEGDTYYYGVIYDWWLNDYDPDAGDTITAQSVSGNSSVTVWANGTIHFGGPIGSGQQVFTYTIRDNSGATATATVTLNFYY